MTNLPPEVQALMDKLGVASGNWKDTPEHLTDIGSVQKQTNTLLKLRDVLVQVQAADQKRLADLKEQLVRLRHGGGS